METYYDGGVVHQKSYDFALRIIKAYKYLTENHEYIISKQLLRSGTSIGANCRESRNAQSSLDFISKLSIALKEADETAYWLELLHDSHYLNDEAFTSIYGDCIALVKLLTKIIKTNKEKEK